MFSLFSTYVCWSSHWTWFWLFVTCHYFFMGTNFFIKYYLKEQRPADPADGLSLSPGDIHVRRREPIPSHCVFTSTHRTMVCSYPIHLQTVNKIQRNQSKSCIKRLSLFPYWSSLLLVCHSTLTAMVCGPISRSSVALCVSTARKNGFTKHCCNCPFCCHNILFLKVCLRLSLNPLIVVLNILNCGYDFLFHVN